MDLLTKKLLGFRANDYDVHFSYEFDRFKFHQVRRLICFENQRFASVVGHTVDMKAQILTLNFQRADQIFNQRIFDHVVLPSSISVESTPRGYALDQNVLMIELITTRGHHRQVLHIRGP